MDGPEPPHHMRVPADLAREQVSALVDHLQVDLGLIQDLDLLADKQLHLSDVSLLQSVSHAQETLPGRKDGREYGEQEGDHLLAIELRVLRYRKVRTVVVGPWNANLEVSSDVQIG